MDVSQATTYISRSLCVRTLSNNILKHIGELINVEVK